MTKVFGMVLAVSLSIGTYATGEDTDSLLDAIRKLADIQNKAVIDRVKSTVEAEKAGLPAKLNDLTTLLLVNFKEVPTVAYLYTLNLTKQQIAAKPQAFWDEETRKNRQHLAQELCSQELAMDFLLAGGAYTFDYVGQEGALLSKVQVDMRDCWGLD